MTESEEIKMNANSPLTLLYDANCPVCSLEMDHLRERDSHSLLRFVDISATGFDATAFGLSMQALDAEIHGVMPDGTVLRGMPVLRLAYEAAGLGWVLKPTGWTLAAPIFDFAYKVFARHRHAISRAAAPLIDATRSFRARQTIARMRACSNGACNVDAHARAVRADASAVKGSEAVGSAS
jgi:predicted DCC family thiol-disulfide oxidoreductase YuxK